MDVPDPDDALPGGLEAAPAILWAAGADGRLTAVAGALVAALDVPLTPGEPLLAALPGLAEALATAGAGQVWHGRLEQGGRAWEASAGPAGEDGSVAGVLVDVTDRRAGERALADSEVRHRTLVEASPDAILTIGRAGAILSANRAAESMFGRTAEDIVGRPLLSLLMDPVPDLYSAEATTMYAKAANDNFVPVDLKMISHEGEEGPLLTATLHDLTDRVALERRLRDLADHDALTGLLNRRRFDEELDRAVARSRRGPTTSTVLLIDLDGLKTVNDTLGHRAGDALIRHAGTALAGRLRSSDVLARLGGDEFGVLLDGTGIEDARRAATQLLAALREEPLVIGERETIVTASAGLAELDAEVESGEEALGRADFAMYEAKGSGRDRIAVFREVSRHRARRRIAWQDRTRDALAENRIELHAQPVLEVATGTIRQHEVLARMRDEDGRLLQPAAFLAPVERTGLVGEIDRWVLEQTVRHLAAAETELVLEVNLSSASIADAALPRHIRRLLADAEVDAWRLVLEITETTAIADMNRAAKFAGELVRHGCRFALDDFGAGLGSFSYLKYLPLEFVKIDGDYIRNLRASRTDQVLTGGVVQVAHGLGMKTIAEYVRDAETLGLIEDLGVDFAQGYHIGRPIPIERVLGASSPG